MTVPTVKTVISIERSLFDRVNQLAEELEVPRSQLLAAAVEEYVRLQFQHSPSDFEIIFAGKVVGKDNMAMT